MSATLQSAFANRTLGDIAASLPGAAAIFRRHKLDYCCGGGANLAEAAQYKGMNLEAVEDELQAAAALALPVPAPQAADDLIDMIVGRFHEAHRRELPELIRLARRVEAVHRDHPLAPHGLADLLERVRTELEDHMAKEEQILFPLLRQGGHPMIAHPIAMMLAEHDDHGVHLREIERLTGEFTPPDGACNTWRALYVGGRKLADDLVEHIHTENNILFPRFTG
ncbi:MAG: iron-sulfur cluster repair protein YtfE [Proteobacteria bacterium]|nr:iron-sulfur cluster repair protein YtfE [Pseudomonadota bacterium]